MSMMTEATLPAGTAAIEAADWREFDPAVGMTCSALPDAAWVLSVAAERDYEKPCAVMHRFDDLVKNGALAMSGNF